MTHDRSLRSPDFCSHRRIHRVVAMEVLPYRVVTVTTDDMPGESRFS